MIPHDEPLTDASPVVAGRVNIGSATSLELRYADDTTSKIPFGTNLFFVTDLPDSKLPVAHGGELVLVARDARGDVVARAVIPADGTPRPKARRASPSSSAPSPTRTT